MLTKRNHMFKKLFLFILAVSILQSHAMKRSHNKRQKTASSISFPDYALWPLDIRTVIIDFSTNNTIAKKPKDAAHTVNALARTNKSLNALINNQQFSDNLIKNIARKFYCSHETIARFLHTQQSKQRLRLQDQLKTLCTTPNIVTQNFKTKSTISQTLDRLIIQNVDLEFTYNHRLLQKTPLMISTDCNINTMFPYLLKKGAKINNANSHGLTALKLATDYPINSPTYKILLAQPELTINQQSRHGESALLRCLIRRRQTPRNMQITQAFITMIKEFLNAGADSELANNDGLTPFEAAKLLANEELLIIIQDAIDKKNQLL